MLFEALERRALFTAVFPQILKDINPGSASGLSAGTNESVSFNGKTYFAANDGYSGTELFASDGTEAGTSLVADLAPYDASSNPRDFVVSGGKLFFIADWTRAYSADPAQAKLFVSDGTTAGTQVVENEQLYYNDPLYGAISESAAGPALVAYDGKIAFIANGARSYYYPDNPSTRLLWVTDGTTDGTIFRLISGASQDSAITHFTPAGKNLFFAIKGDGTSGSHDTIGLYDGVNPFFTDQAAPFYDGQTIEEIVPAGSAAYVRTNGQYPLSGRLYQIDATGTLTGGFGPFFGVNDVIAANGHVVASGVIDYRYGGDPTTQTLFDVTKANGTLQFAPLTTYITYRSQPIELTAIGKYIYFAEDDLNRYSGVGVGRLNVATNQRLDVFETNGMYGYTRFSSIVGATANGPAFDQGPDGAVYFEAVPFENYDTGDTLLYRILGSDTSLVVERFPVITSGPTLDLRPSGFMAIGNNWYTPGSSTYEGREWRLFAQPIGYIYGRIYEAIPGQSGESYGLDYTSGVVPYLDNNNNGQLDAGEPTSEIGYAGTYVFNNLPAGQYRLRLSTPAGTQFVSPTTNATLLINVPEEGYAGPPPFALRIRKTLTAQLFNDLDGDNFRDTGEAALSSRTVFLDANTNGTLDAGEISVLTDANGLATFNVYNGTYQVRQVLPTGWKFTKYAAMTQIVTTGISLNVSLGSQVITQYDSGVSGTLFNDTNANGLQDAGELALAGRTVFDDRNNNGLLDTGERSAVSSSSGVYFVGTYEPGTHTVRQVLPAGWDQTTPTAGTGYTVDVAAHISFSGRNFGSRPTPVPPTNITIEAETGIFSGGTAKGSANGGFTGTGYADYAGLNSAAQWTVSRTAAGSATISFRYANGGTTNRPLTVYVNGAIVGTLPFAPTGGWSTWASVSVTANLIAGNNIISAVASTSNGGANVDSLTISGGTTPPPPPATGLVTGFLFDDTSKDGVYQANEPRSVGKTVFIDLDADGLLDANERRVTTDANGEWSFNALPAGNYAIRPVLASGTVLSSAPINLALETGQAIGGLSIGTKTTAVPPPPTGTTSIAGTVFNDNNNNAKYDAGDGIGKGVVVFLDTDNDGVLDSGEKSVTTDTNGKFTFTGLAAGTYRVRRVFAAGQTYSTPLANLTLTAGQAKTGVLVGTKKV